jgi:hypothetical protein
MLLGSTNEDDNDNLLLVRLHDTRQENDEEKLVVKVYDCYSLTSTCRPTDGPLVTVSKSRVLDIRFVVQTNDDDNNDDDNIGRTDTYKIITTDDNFLPFACSHPGYPMGCESVARTVWTEIGRVRRVLRVLMCRSTMHQAEFARGAKSTYLSTTTVGYLKRQLCGKEGVSEVKEKQKSAIDYNLHLGIVRSAKRRLLMSSKLDFHGKNGITALCSVFGKLAVVGVRERRPRLQDRPQGIIGNDIVHYMLESENELVSSLEFLSDGQVLVKVHYRAYHAKFDANGQPLNCPSSLTYALLTRTKDYDDDNDNNDDGDVLCVGAQFLWKNALFQIVSINGEAATCLVTSDTSIEVEMETGIVADLVAAYLE